MIYSGKRSRKKKKVVPSMGNHKFKFSDMMPNTWFYKLKDMSKTKKHKTPFSSSSTSKSQFSQPRSSFSYTTRKSIRVDKIYNSHSYSFLDPPRRSSSSSSKKKSKRKTIYKPSPKHIPSSVSNYVSVSNKLNSSSSVSSTEEDKFPELDFLDSPSSEFDSVDSQSVNELASDWPTSCSCHFTSSATDIIMNMNDKAHSNEFNNLNADYATISEIDQLPPILTKTSNSIKNIKQDNNVKAGREKEPTNRGSSPVSRKHYSSSSGVKLRTNSTKVASKRNSVSSSKRRSKAKKESCSASTGTSFAVVKASIDPEKDFRESMIEMVVENNIRASKDLENLLACYLSLNSNEYHDLIIKAFETIWFNLSDLHL